MNLRRITSGGKWLPEVDGLRCVAILSVLVCHSLTHRQVSGRFGEQPVAWVIDHGSALYGLGTRGVVLFFGISGFILAQPFLKAFLHKPRSARFELWPYYRRRLTRLEPPYLISLLLATVFYAGFAHYRLGVVLHALLKHVFYVHAFFPGMTLNVATWSLEVEVQFYLIAPLLGRVYRIGNDRLRLLLWAALCAVSLAAAHFIPVNPHVPLLVEYLPIFLVGFVVADLRAITQNRLDHWTWDVISILGWSLFLTLPEGTSGLGLMGLIFLLLSAAMSGPANRAVLGFGPVAILGGMCYSIYLTHLLCFSLLERVDARYNHFTGTVATLGMTLAVLLPVTLLVGTGFYIAIERPCMKPEWYKRFLPEKYRRNPDQVGSKLSPRTPAA